MASRKKNLSPLPDTIWCSAGRSAVERSAGAVEQRLGELAASGAIVEFAACEHPGGRGVGRAFEALWHPGEGTTVRARMQIAYPGEDPLSGWELTAEASRPWDWSWPSPVYMFWPKSRTSPWDLAGSRGFLRFRAANSVDSPESARESVRTALAAEAEIHVLTADDFHDDGPGGELPLVRYLPAGFTGRLVEHRVAPWALRTVNRELECVGLRLAAGGALIVPQRRRPSQLGAADLVLPGYPGRPGRPSALIDAVTRHALFPRQARPELHRRVALLRDRFTLSPGTGSGGGLQEELAAALRAGEDLRKELAEVSALLGEAQRAAQAARVGEAAALREAEVARVALQEARAANEADGLGQALREAEARRDAAEAGAEAAEGRLDEQAREIGWLRSRLAAAGRPVAAAPPEQGCPSSWEELVERAGRELECVVLADTVRQSSPQWRGHPSEPVWRRRTWEALCALDAYARAKAERGSGLLPHLSAYLAWEEAPVPLPRGRYSANESQYVLNTARLREMRMLPVPRAVHPAGRVLMAEHIRIGSGKPPAPRLHFHDHTSGDGRIYVGHIGNHLRNASTN
ncbi:hypothetical protein [Streptomyces yaizuensis]|uniref:Uncharacterized protein n=1 Tax=Streptomyces yaizuensis TaxID=2989713 RepID=A0ABQ5PAI3_9ACTN|nr:hypothetical protein [Streptomyces sp. YSPA8]GLF99599.1 hypothetical protein SYYSPA8_34900 [Streptomyces sp. YSPA8]